MPAPPNLAELTTEVGRRIDTFAARADPIQMSGVAAEPGSNRGVPSAMWDGPVDEDGWVRWKVLPSDASPAEVIALEDRFGVRFPPVWMAYLTARCHLFDPLLSPRHGRVAGVPPAPVGRALVASARLLETHDPLHRAGYVPIAGWGDGWGPVCFDATRVRDDGEAPVVWLDHEALAEVSRSGRLAERAAVEPLAQPLYGSVREMLGDLFASPEGKAPVGV